MQGLAILDFIPNAKGRPSRIFRKWFSSKESACNAGDTGLIPGWEDPRMGRSPEEGNGNPLQGSCPANPMDRGAWWATVHGAAKSWT